MIPKEHLDAEIKSLEGKINNWIVVEFELGKDLQKNISNATIYSKDEKIYSNSKSDVHIRYVQKDGCKKLLVEYFPNKSAEPSKYEAEIKKTAEILKRFL